MAATKASLQAANHSSVNCPNFLECQGRSGARGALGLALAFLAALRLVTWLSVMARRLAGSCD